MAKTNYIAQFIKEQRSKSGLTQEDLAAKSGVGLRFVRELEQGKDTLKMDKVNQVLQLFGYQLVPGKELDPYQINRDHFDRSVRILLRNKTLLVGNIIEGINDKNEWVFIKNNNAIAYRESKDPALLTRIAHRDIERIENI